ncbi:MAG: MgtC/SapB family protein [Steroidobacteraceae bacterium]
MNAIELEMCLRLLVALAMGSAIGLERSFHERPAGFRTHALVCVSTALLMFLPAYEPAWLAQLANGRLVLDPTRMAQGIMTGIGFIGAGAIMKDGPSVRGLTTAASIWMTATIGILVGVGFFVPALAATVITLGTLSLFGALEDHLPVRIHLDCALRFEAATAPDEAALRALFAQRGFEAVSLGYERSEEGGWFEYRAIVRTLRRKNVATLAASLRALPDVRAFRISPLAT